MAAPAAPGGLTGFVTGGTTATLSWVDNSTDENSFLIGYRLNTFYNLAVYTSVPANSTTVNLTGLDPGTFHQFVVVALDAANVQSPLSNLISLTTPSVYKAGYLNQAFSFSLASANFPAVTQYAISDLPPGLTLNATSGLISGTPTSAVRVSGTVTATLTNSSTLTRPLIVCIFANPPALQDPVAGPAPANRSLIIGAAPTVISLAGLFTDPDVASAARLTTNRGNLDFVFYPNSAPQTVANFLGYVNRGDFANTIFHRSIPNFIIQAGAFHADATASAGPSQPPVVNEPNITSARGTIAMAKLGGNPNSATNQFFINLADNGTNLDSQNEGFTVFGRVAGTGMTVADAIAGLARGNYSSINGALADAPVTITPVPATYNPLNLVIISAAAAIPPLALTAASSQPATASVTLTGTDLTLTPLATGTTAITLTATDLDNQTVQSSFQVTVGDAYLIWAGQRNFEQPSDALAGADPDHDGLINLTEFALASSPVNANASNILPGLAQGHLTLSFTVRSPLTGTSVILQSAATLTGPWTDRWSSSDGLTHPWITTGATTDDAISIIARDPDPLDPSRRFLRLKVTRP